jgi:hypothetical protein
MQKQTKKFLGKCYNYHLPPVILCVLPCIEQDQVGQARNKLEDNYVELNGIR